MLLVCDVNTRVSSSPLLLFLAFRRQAAAESVAHRQQMAVHVAGILRRVGCFPDELRGQFWMLITGADAHYYSPQAPLRAKAASSSGEGGGRGANADDADTDFLSHDTTTVLFEQLTQSPAVDRRTLRTIEVDLSRTFPRHLFFRQLERERVDQRQQQQQQRQQVFNSTSSSAQRTSSSPRADAALRGETRADDVGSRGVKGGVGHGDDPATRAQDGGGGGGGGPSSLLGSQQATTTTTTTTTTTKTTPSEQTLNHTRQRQYVLGVAGTGQLRDVLCALAAFDEDTGLSLIHI